MKNLLIMAIVTLTWLTAVPAVADSSYQSRLTVTTRSAEVLTGPGRTQVAWNGERQSRGLHAGFGQATRSDNGRRHDRDRFAYRERFERHGHHDRQAWYRPGYRSHAGHDCALRYQRPRHTPERFAGRPLRTPPRVSITYRLAW